MVGIQNTSRKFTLINLFISTLLTIWIAAVSTTGIAVADQLADPSTEQELDDHILVVGDSISSAYGMSAEDGWVSHLQTRAKKEFNVKVVNASVTGDTTGNGLGRLPKLLREYQPALLIIELGGNDGLRGLSIKKLRQNLHDMAAAAKDTGADVIIVGVQLPGNYGKAYNKLFSNSFSQAAADSGASLVPSLFEGMNAAPKWFQSDGIHPSVLAQPVMFENVWRVAHPLLEKLVQTE